MLLAQNNSPVAAHRTKMGGMVQTEFWILLLLGVGARIFFLLKTEYMSDDAFITYRYVQNILTGNGYAYNVGEKVLGTSSPAYTLLLVALGKVFGMVHLPAISLVVSLAADTVSFIILWKLMSPEFGAARFIAAACFSLYPKIVLISVSGMEASFALAAMLLSLWAGITGRYYLAALSLGMCILARPDAIVWFLICTAYALYISRGVRLRYVLAAVILPMSWFVFCVRYFGNWIPHSISAKWVSWQHLFPAFDPLRVLGGYLPTVLIEGIDEHLKVFFVLLFLIPYVLGTWKLIQLKSPLVLFSVFFVLYNLAFCFGRVLMADWYYFPAFLAYFVVSGFALECLLGSWLRRRVSFGATAVLASTIILALLVLDVCGLGRWRENLGGLFIRENRALGIWLREHSSRNQTVMVEPIGNIGYYSGLYVHDYIGLVSPSVISFRRKYDSDAWYLDYLQTLRPDFLVLRNWEIPSNRLFHGYGDGIFHAEQEREWFNEHYEPVDWRATVPRDSTYLVLYGLRRKNLAERL